MENECWAYGSPDVDENPKKVAYSQGRTAKDVCKFQDWHKLDKTVMIEMT